MSIETPARIAVLGAGPVGLEAALYARYLGYEVEIFERGQVADHVRQWGHVRMFTPFALNRSPLGLAALKAQDPAWQPPGDDELLTGQQYAERYLAPLAHSDLLVDGLREQTEVLAIGRDGMLKNEPVDLEQREERDLRLLLRSTNPADHGRQWFATFDAVIDATGTYGQPNWLGHGGLPAIGELAARDHIEYGLADVLGARHADYAGRNILLVGSGHSAATSLAALAELAAHTPDTWVTWISRESGPAPIHVMDDDPFAERHKIARLANRLATDDANHVTLLEGTTIEEVAWHPDRDRFAVRLLGNHAGEMEFDRIIANVGHRPDGSLYRELQVEESAYSGAPLCMSMVLHEFERLAVMTEPRFEPQVLVTPEPDFYVLGAKSYGRDSRFLIAHGLQQIRALFTLIGDRADLNLYATMAGLC